MKWDTSEFDAAIQQYERHYEPERVRRATLLAAELLKAKAQEKTPVETGNLRGSADARPDGDGAEVYYPGPYARYQHYGLDFHHETGQALYLEMAFIEGADEAFDLMAHELQ